MHRGVKRLAVLERAAQGRGALRGNGAQLGEHGARVRSHGLDGDLRAEVAQRRHVVALCNVHHVGAQHGRGQRRGNVQRRKVLLQHNAGVVVQQLAVHGAVQLAAQLLRRARGVVLEHADALRVGVRAAAAAGNDAHFSRFAGLLCAQATACRPSTEHCLV